MNLRDLVKKTRSYRRFDESFHIELNSLESFIDLARLSPSGGNRQPLKFLVYNTPETCGKVFPYLVWASYLTEWHGPEKGERPTAYVIILGDKTVSDNFGVDHGIAAQSIMLGVSEVGLGGCMLQSIKREELRSEIELPDQYEILLILALGKTVENVIIDEIKNNDVKYWRDNNNNHHVPKRNLKELIVKL